MKVNIVVISTWVLLIWQSNVVNVFVDFGYVSYFFYAFLVLAFLWLVLGALYDDGVDIPELRPIILIVVPVVLGALFGYTFLDEVPARVQAATAMNGRDYLRAFLLLPVLLILFACRIAISVNAGLKVERILFPILLTIWFFNFYVFASAYFSGVQLSLVQGERNQYLSGTGFHPNALGSILVVGLASLLGYLRAPLNSRLRSVLAVSAIVTMISILLTFSRGSILAMFVLTILYGYTLPARQKLVLALLFFGLLLLSPDIIFQRFSLGFEGGGVDFNKMSSGRLELIWLPLIPDVMNNFLIGQGTASIMWTDTMKSGKVFYPVGMAHNGYIDLLLDFGIVGTVLIMAFYFYVLRKCMVEMKYEIEPIFYGSYYAGYLSLIAFFVLALTNERLIPGYTYFILWIIIGILLGRHRASRNGSG